MAWRMPICCSLRSGPASWCFLFPKRFCKEVSTHSKKRNKKGKKREKGITDSNGDTSSKIEFLCGLAKSLQFGLCQIILVPSILSALRAAGSQEMSLGKADLLSERLSAHHARRGGVLHVTLHTQGS
jgi:hypothetical protein